MTVLRKHSSRQFAVMLIAGAAFFLFVSTRTEAQSTALWIRSYKGKHPSSVTRDPRFVADIRRFLAFRGVPLELAPTARFYGRDLATTALAYMTAGSDDGVKVQGHQVTVQGCGIHGSGCALLWSTSQRSSAEFPLLALCIIEPTGPDTVLLRVYTSSRSRASLPEELIQSIQAWQDDMDDDGYFFRPDAAILISKEGSTKPLDLNTLLPLPRAASMKQ